MGKFKLMACGGTFDLFHAGHKAFLQDVLGQSEKVVLGITSDLYVKSFKDGNKIESFEFRRGEVQNFLNSIGAKDRIQISPIDNFYGPLLSSDFNVQAIAVTPQTESMAVKINLKRKENNLPELKVINLPLKLAEDGKVLSATRIRKGEINRDGRLYLNPKWQNKILVLPENLRTALQRPWGEVLKDVPDGINGSKTVAIGDITVQKFNQKNVDQFLSIVDFLVQRQIRFYALPELGLNSQNLQKVKNPHGMIMPELFWAIEKAFKMAGKKTILVEGEEDLAVLPVLLISPLGFSVFYGQPNEGLVKIQVTEENKEKAYQLVENFDKSKAA
jgi:pantetheine-phosphate adenylyltransferase